MYTTTNLLAAWPITLFRACTCLGTFGDVVSGCVLVGMDKAKDFPAADKAYQGTVSVNDDHLLSK
jgi:hypothetical protein